MLALATAGAPTTGTWGIGTSVVDDNGVLWNCTATGSPGTWRAAIVTVGAATGNDGAQLRAALSGVGDVYLTPGATYTISDTTAWPAFTNGHLHMQGATFNFTGTPAYTGSGTPIGAPGNSAWSNVVIENGTFTSSASCTWSAIFGSSCGRLVFLDCTSRDLVCRMTNPTSGDLYVTRHQFLQSASPPSMINQAFSVPGSVQHSLANTVTTLGAASVTTTAATAASVVVGDGIYGPGIPVGTTITNITGPSNSVYTIATSGSVTSSASVTLYYWAIQQGYHCVLEDALVEFQQVNGAGSILSAVSTAPGYGSSLEVRGGSAFASGLYNMDGVIDVEPVGWQPFAKVSVRDFDVTNSVLYLTGADFIDAGEGCHFHYTAANTQDQCYAFDGYNYNYTVSNGPPTGVVDIHDFYIYEDAFNSATINPSSLVDYEVPITSLSIHDFYVNLTTATSYTLTKGLFYVASTAEKFWVTDGVVDGGGAAVAHSSASVTSGSNLMTVTSPLGANVAVGWVISGTNIPTNTTITVISLSGSLYTITMSANATGSAVETITFDPPWILGTLVVCGSNPTSVRLQRVEVPTTTFAHLVALNAGSGTVTEVNISDNSIFGGGSTLYDVGLTLTNFIYKNNSGRNPVGSFVPGTAFSLPASTGTWTNKTGVDGELYCTAAGSVTAVSVQGVSVSGTMVIGDRYRVAANGTFNCTYSGAPTLVFVGE